MHSFISGFCYKAQYAQFYKWVLLPNNHNNKRTLKIVFTFKASPSLASPQILDTQNPKI